MNKLRKYIIILIVIIVFLLLLLITLLKSNNIELDNNKIGDVGEIIEITNQEEDVVDFSTFKSVELCVQKYYNMMNNEDSEFYQREEDGQYKRLDDKTIRQKRLSLLSSKYIKTNKINESNIEQYINVVNETYNVITLKMKRIINQNVDQYLAYGICTNSNNEVAEEFYIIVNVDNSNKTFSIEPILNSPKSMDEIKLNNDNQEIEKNDYNEYNEEIYTNENQAENYLIFYKTIALAKPELLYNYMEDEYKNERFGSYNNFVEYIKQEENEINKIRLKEYQVNYDSNNTEYVCKDQFDNIYVFEQTIPMMFTFRLDNYTIATTKFKETYGKADEKKKVQMNIDKFTQMINRHDYKTSYNYISQGFKNNYFKTQKQFEDFIKNKFFDYNKITFKNIVEQNGIYICDLDIEDVTGTTSEIKNVSIIMRLKDNLDFEMAFSIE